jgi:hypothetical protein
MVVVMWAVLQQISRALSLMVGMWLLQAFQDAVG